MTTSTIQLAGTRILLNGPLTCEEHIDAFLAAAARLEREGALVLYPLSPDHPANSVDLFADGEFDALAAARVETRCIESAELMVVLPGWDTSADVIGDVFTAESAGVGWVEYERLAL